MKCILASSQENEFCKELGNERFYVELKTDNGFIRIEYQPDDEVIPDCHTNVIGFRCD